MFFFLKGREANRVKYGNERISKNPFPLSEVVITFVCAIMLDFRLMGSIKCFYQTHKSPLITARSQLGEGTMEPMAFLNPKLVPCVYKIIILKLKLELEIDIPPPPKFSR